MQRVCSTYADIVCRLAARHYGWHVHVGMYIVLVQDNAFVYVRVGYLRFCSNFRFNWLHVGIVQTGLGWEIDNY